ncbi:MAG: B12-binding domain-containing radical SAM protein [Fluviicola sp.]|nr:MAG: B12-binding domain-containing radical SAM protein [Fluviicola sp.]
MGKTVLLYNPSTVFFDLPLALLAIGTPLESDYNIIIIDARIEKNIDELLQRHIENTLLVGVTSLTGAPLKDAIAFSKKVKALDDTIPVVWGGWHTSLFPEQVLKDVPAVDISVQGQGEESFREIVEAIDNQLSLSEIKGIAYRKKDGSIQKTAPRTIQNMNSFERLNYDLIDVEKYFKAKGKRQFDYISSTGCFFRCTFCADPFVFNRKFTSLESDRIFEDLKYYHEKYQFDDVNFQDETFFTYPKNILELASKLKSIGTPFTWASTMRADQGNRMSFEDFKLCKEGGLRRLLIGVESGTQEMMDWLKKDIKLEHVLLCAERCRELNISVIFPFIVGFPNETNKSIQGTKSMVRKLAFMSDGFETPIFYFKPYPGTQITSEAVKNGSYKLPETIQEWSEFDYIGSKGPWVSNQLFSEMERLKFYLKLNRQQKVYLSPLRWVAKKRIQKMFFGLPLEKRIVELIKPSKELS